VVCIFYNILDNSVHFQEYSCTLIRGGGPIGPSRNAALSGGHVAPRVRVRAYRPRLWLSRSGACWVLGCKQQWGSPDFLFFRLHLLSTPNCSELVALNSFPGILVSGCVCRMPRPPRFWQVVERGVIAECQSSPMRNYCSYRYLHVLNSNFSALLLILGSICTL
jgi:hypothetical protein